MWRSKLRRPMHLVSLESFGFRNLSVNRYTTVYCYRQLLFKVHHIYGLKNKHLGEKAKTLLNKSEDGSGPGQLQRDVVQGVS